MSDNEGSDVLDGLEERLQNHAKAFESLLALTPAREYYGSHTVDGQDPSEQWSRKKQTKQEKAAAKKAKLDPANNKSALDVMKERELKRKRELGMAEDDEARKEATEDAPRSKKQKAEVSVEEAEEKRKRKAEARKEKRQKKQEKNAQKKAKLEAKKAARQSQVPSDAAAGSSEAIISTTVENEQDSDSGDDDDDAEHISHSEMERLDFSGLGGSDDDHHSDNSSVPSSPAVNSPAFDVSANHSTASSSSSIVPPTEKEKLEPRQQSVVQSGAASKDKGVQQQKPLPEFQPFSGAIPANAVESESSSPKPSIPKIDGAALQERLRARIEELRAKRKADGMGSRQDLLEQRRQKGEQRKAHKKELRRKAKEEEMRKQEERLRGSGSPLASPDIFSPQARSENFSFGRLGFEDGTTVNSDLTGLQDARKRKGPQDAKTALIAAQNKEKRISGYDDAKKSDIAEKDSWLNATKRAHGAKVRDDTSLLRKALKRKEKQKSKSEKEWKEREENIIKGKEMKQKKREANLQKRKDEKGQKGKKKPAKGGKKGRPGFEGRFKA